VLAELSTATERLVRDARVRELYPEYLFTLHCIVRASVPLMETARDRARSMSSEDPVAAVIDDYLGTHIEEERNHDEWLLDDLEAIGVDHSRVVHRPPSPTVASAVGAQYYWILHFHPVALLAWIGLLEGYPPTPRTIDRLMGRTGYGPEAFRTLMAHADLDPGHGDELFDTLDRLSLTREQATAVGLNAMSSVRLLARALDEVTAPA
jgi:pyrroloquinoline quinone (PQQ) biosynthesis protein C